MNDRDITGRTTQFKAIKLSPENGTGSETTVRATQQQIWERRAAELAKVEVREDDSEQISLAFLRLGSELYGLEAHYIFDIRPVERITPVPRVPAWVAGVVNLRGRILSVMDLQCFLGLPDSGRARRSLLVAAETADTEIAFWVDDVISVESMPLSHIQDASGAIRGIRPDCIRGITFRVNGETSAMVVILDLPALASDKQLIVYEEVV